MLIGWFGIFVSTCTRLLYYTSKMSSFLVFRLIYDDLSIFWIETIRYILSTVLSYVGLPFRACILSAFSSACGRFERGELPFAILVH